MRAVGVADALERVDAMSDAELRAPRLGVTPVHNLSAKCQPTSVQWEKAPRARPTGAVTIVMADFGLEPLTPGTGGA